MTFLEKNYTRCNVFGLHLTRTQNKSLVNCWLNQRLELTKQELNGGKDGYGEDEGRSKSNLYNSHAQHRVPMILNSIKHDDTGGWKVLTPKKTS